MKTISNSRLSINKRTITRLVATNEAKHEHKSNTIPTATSSLFGIA